MKKNYLLLMAVFCFALVFSAQADDSTITQENATASNLGLFGSHTWDIAVDPADNNYIYLATYYSPNGFFYSADGGITWNGLSNDVDYGAGKAVEVNPDNGHVYVLLDGLWVSNDHGVTFREAYYTETTAMLYARDALYLGTSGGDIKITEDEAISFSSYTVCEGKVIWSLASASDALYALCYDYDAEASAVYASTDNGASWTDLNGSIDAETVAVNPANNYVYLIPSSTGGTTYRSIDNGATWTELADAPLTGHMNFNSTGRIYVGWNYSDDDGDTWVSFGTGGDYNHIMMPDPTDDSILYDTSVPGFLKSTDSGATWTESVENITAVEVTGIAQATDKNIVWVATQNGPAKTENFLDEDPDWQYLPTNDNYMSSGYDAVWVKPDDANYVVASTSQDLYYSVDAGATWQQADVEITLTGAVFQLVGDSEGNLYGVVGPNVSTGVQSGGVIKSMDHGATWDSLGFPDDQPARSIAVDSNGNLYVGADGIYKYDGSEWSKSDAPDDDFLSIVVDPEDDNTIYALSSDAGAYKSSDAGATWEEKNSGLGDVDEEFTEFNTLAIQTSTNPDTLYLSGVKSQTQKGVVYKSSDGAENWDKLYTGKSGETFNVLLFDGLVAGNSRGIYNMKSRADLTFKRTGAALKIKLRDAATERKLKHKNIKLYKKKGGEWHFWKKVKTNTKGNASLIINFTRTTNLKAVWKPAGHFADEYTKAVETKKIRL